MYYRGLNNLNRVLGLIIVYLERGHKGILLVTIPTPIFSDFSICVDFMFCPFNLFMAWLLEK